MSALSDMIAKQKAEAESNEKATPQPPATAPAEAPQESASPVFQLSTKGIAKPIGARSGCAQPTSDESGTNPAAQDSPNSGAVVPQDGQAVQADSQGGKGIAGGKSSSGTIQYANQPAASTQVGRATPPNQGESPASAPPRDLPPNLTEQQLKFVASLDSVYACFHDPKMLSGTIRSIMVELQQNNKFIELVADSDVATMIRGMRDTLGMVQVAKQSKKRGSTKKRGEDALAKSLKVGNVLDKLMLEKR